MITFNVCVKNDFTITSASKKFNKCFFEILISGLKTFFLSNSICVMMEQSFAFYFKAP